MAATGIFQMKNIGNEIEEIAEQDIPLTTAITAITIHQLEKAINFERLLRYGEEMKHDESARACFFTAFDLFEELTHMVDAEILETEELAEGAIEHAATPEAREEFEHVLSALKKIEVEHADYEKHVKHTAELLATGEVGEAIEGAEAIEIEEEQLDHELEALLLEIEKFTEKSTNTAKEHETFGLMLLIIISGAATIIGFVMTFFLVRVSVVRPLGAVVQAVTRLAAGDTSAAITARSNDD